MLHSLLTIHFLFPHFTNLFLILKTLKGIPNGPRDRRVRQFPELRPAASLPRPTSQCVAFLDFGVKFCRQNAVYSKLEVLAGGGRGGAALVGVRDHPRPGFPSFSPLSLSPPAFCPVGCSNHATDSASSLTHGPVWRNLLTLS